MRRSYSLLLLFSLFLFDSPAGWCQGSEFRWERTDRTADGWMGGIESDADVAVTPDGVTLVGSSEGIFRIVERTEGGVTEHYAELINREIEGPFSFIGTIGERIYLWRKDGNSRHASTDDGITWGRGNEVWTSSDNGRTWELILAEVDIDHVTVVDGGSVSSSAITAYDTEADSLLVFDPTGQHVATRGIPFPRERSFPFPQMIASSSGLLYIWEEIDETTPIFRSSDLGETWVLTAQASFENIRPYHLLYAGDSLLIASTAEGLAASHDRGESWTAWEWTIQDTSEDYRNWRYYSLSAREDRIIVTWFTSLTHQDDTHPLMQSVDGGESWVTCAEAPGTEITMTEEGSLYSIREGVLWRSDGCGSPWKRVYGDFRYVSAGSVVSIGSDFFAVTGGVLPGKNQTRWRQQLMRSRDDGATWEPIMDSVISILEVSEEGTLYVRVRRSTATTDTGGVVFEQRRDIMRSTDRGETWHSLSDVGAPSPVEWPHPGTGWRPLQLQGEEYVMVFHKGVAEDSASHPNDVLSYSSDGGATFEAIDSATLRGNTDVDYEHALLLPDGRIYGGPVGYRNESTHYGRFDPRTGVHEELPAPVPFTDLQIAPSGRLYGWTADWRDVVRRDSAGRLFRSEDGGESWTEVITPAPERAIDEVSEGVDGTLYLVLDTRTPNDETYQSTDDGITWSRTADPDLGIGFDSASGLPRFHYHIESIDTLHDFHLAKLSYIIPDSLTDGYVRVTEGATLVYSTNGGGQSWHPASDDDLREGWITSFAVNDRGVVVLGTASSGLYRTLGPSGVDEERGEGPVMIDLW